MANEITIAANMAYADGVNSVGNLATPPAVLKTVANKGFTRVEALAPTTAAAIPLGSISAPGYVLLINRDPTNYVQILTGTGGVIFARLDADVNANGQGGMALLKLDSGAQAPFWKANVAAALVDVFIINT